MRNRHPVTWQPLLLSAPAAAIIVGLLLFPLLYNLYLSFFRKHAFLQTKDFVGFANYSQILHSQEFWGSFRNGAVYAFSTIILQLLLGVGAALLLNRKFAGRNILRGILLFPYLLPTVVVVILWKWLLNSSYGLINYILLSLRLSDTPVVWLSDNNIMLTLIIVSTWQFSPFVLVTVLARLQSIPKELYSAAQIDGASPWAQFTHVTLPQLKGVLVAVILLRSIWMFTKFDTVWLLAGKEAVGKYIQTLPVLTFRTTFDYLQAGMGAAVASILFLTLALGTLVYTKSVLQEESK